MRHASRAVRELVRYYSILVHGLFQSGIVGANRAADVDCVEVVSIYRHRDAPPSNRRSRHSSAKLWSEQQLRNVLISCERQEQATLLGLVQEGLSTKFDILPTH